MGNTFEEQKQQFIQNYNQARPIMAILGDEVRQEILLVLIEAGGNGGIRVGDIQKRSHISRSAVSHDQKGLSCTLTSGAGGMGGKTGLYDVGVPIKENTKKGYKMAYEGDSIDLGYPGMNSRRVRVGRNIAHTLTTGSHQGTLHFVDMSVPPLVTEHARCLNTRQDSSIHNHKGECFGVLVEEGPRAVINPAKEKIRQNGRRMKEPEEAMFTITASDRHGIIYHGRIRRLTPRECLRLQGYRDEQIDKMEAVTSDNQLYKQAGNGVTVNVIEAIGKCLKEVDEEIRAGG